MTQYENKKFNPAPVQSPPPPTPTKELNIFDRLLRFIMIYWSEILLFIDGLLITDVLFTKIWIPNLTEPLKSLFYIAIVISTILLIYLGWIDFKTKFKKKNWKEVLFAKVFIGFIVLFVVIQLSVISATAISIYLLQPNFKLNLFYRQVLELGISLLFLYPYMEIFEFLKSRNKLLKYLFKTSPNAQRK